MKMINEHKFEEDIIKLVKFDCIDKSTKSGNMFGVVSDKNTQIFNLKSLSFNLEKIHTIIGQNVIQLPNGALVSSTDKDIIVWNCEKNIIEKANAGCCGPNDNCNIF